MVEKIAELKITRTEIPGLLVVDIPSLEDERGYFQEKFQKEKLVILGLPEKFTPVQHNISYNFEKGVIRGIHAEPWDKFISVIAGKVFAAFVDLRPENFGKKYEIVLDYKKGVFLPEGIGNSYQTLEPNTVYSYLVNAHWSPNAVYRSVNVLDQDLGINWPIATSEAIISEKDRNNPMLKEIV